MCTISTIRKDKMIKKKLSMKKLFGGFCLGIIILVIVSVAVYETTIEKPETNKSHIKFEKFESKLFPISAEDINTPENDDSIKQSKKFPFEEKITSTSKKFTTQTFRDKNSKEKEKEKEEAKKVKIPTTDITKSASQEEANDVFNTNDLVENVKMLAPVVNADSALNKIQNISLKILAAKVNNVMVPGTQWCGREVIASSRTKLGAARKAELCCSQHNACADIIEVGQTKYGLINKGVFALSRCDCDQKLYNCLKKVNNVVADVIGFAYFTIFRKQCFKEDYPIVECKKWAYTSLVYKKRDMKRCVEYVLDLESPKKYQLFDSPYYC